MFKTTQINQNQSQKICNKFSFIWKLFLLILILVFVCEYALFHLSIYLCSLDLQPLPEHESVEQRALVITDLHVLGKRKGHWVDRIKREWQMHISFILAQRIFDPQHVWFLGDLLEEGQLGNNSEFIENVKRFQSVFPMQEKRKWMVVPGNHDIGFHDRMLFFEPTLRTRFEKTFGTSLAKLRMLHNQPIITLNSMALHEDSCGLCASTAQKILDIRNKLLRICGTYDEDNFEQQAEICETARPIVLLHFPLFRENDAHCNETDSAVHSGKQYSEYRPNIECVNQESTQMLLNVLQPKAFFNGHSHFGCTTEHKLDNGKTSIEYTIGSFNWRNHVLPSYAIVRLKGSYMDMHRCYLPNENVIMSLYVITLITATFLFFVRRS